MRQKFIYVTFKKEGIHCYPDAADNPKLATGDWDDVSFLANRHRHIFHFRVEVEVFDNDRDLEFIQEKRFMERLYNGVLELNHKSCEMLSDELFAILNKRYNYNRDIRIDISEDGENGCYMFYEKGTE